MTHVLDLTTEEIQSLSLEEAKNVAFRLWELENYIESDNFSHTKGIYWQANKAREKRNIAEKHINELVRKSII